MHHLSSMDYSTKSQRVGNRAHLVASQIRIDWHSGWSQETFFSNRAPLVLPRFRVTDHEVSIVRRIDWLLAGRLSRLWHQAEGSTASDWTMNLLFLGEDPLAVLWYDPSTVEIVDAIAKAGEVLCASGRESMCFVTGSPMSHLQARKDQVRAVVSKSGIKSLNIWAT